MTAAVVVFGATGYTGRKTVAELVQRGLRPTLAGRDGARLAALAHQYGGLPTCVTDVQTPDALRAVLRSGDILVTTVGPFMRFGQAALDTALATGAHYVDSTGEPAFIRRVFETAHTRAQASGRTFLTAFGYDYVPGHTAAAAALEAAGPTARRVDIGYFAADGSAMSASEGTRASLVGAALDPGLFWRGGRLVEDMGATRWCSFTVNGRDLDAVSVPGSEHLWLPASYPHLTDIGVYLGWFGKHSRTLARISRATAPVLSLQLVARGLKKVLPMPVSSGQGPSDAELARSGSHIVASARDAHGRELARAELIGTDGYSYTARMLAWAAEALARGAAKQAGALGPLGAFGYPEMVEANRECGLKLSVSHPART